jgi:hypothetical protein
VQCARGAHSFPACLPACAVLDDDVDFINEVAAGQATAPDMDPTQELKRLAKKFELWRQQFKASEAAAWCFLICSRGVAAESGPWKQEARRVCGCASKLPVLCVLCRRACCAVTHSPTCTCARVCVCAQEKLSTAEDVLKKLDRMAGIALPPGATPHGARVHGPGGGAGAGASGGGPPYYHPHQQQQQHAVYGNGGAAAASGYVGGGGYGQHYSQQQQQPYGGAPPQSRGGYAQQGGQQFYGGVGSASSKEKGVLGKLFKR